MFSFFHCIYPKTILKNNNEIDLCYDLKFINVYIAFFCAVLYNYIVHNVTRKLILYLKRRY